MAMHAEISGPNYVVLTRLGDSWILRAAHESLESAENEAFRWRRIYGPGRTRIAACPPRQSEHTSQSNAGDPIIIDVKAEPANDLGAPPSHRLPARQALVAEPLPAVRSGSRPRLAPAREHKLDIGETLLRALVIYLGYSLASKLIDLAILFKTGQIIG